jgi:hypothetical protein
MELKDKIAVMQAYAEGKPIEIRNKAEEPLHVSYGRTWASHPAWEQQQQPVQFNFTVYDYRIKPEPREIFANIYPTGSPLLAHLTADEARRSALPCATRVAVKFREVIED